MSTEMQPDELMRRIQEIQTAVDVQASSLVAESFSGTDEAKTVRVTLDGRQWLTDIQLQDGLLRLGIETVSQRVNEAIRNAQDTATEAGEIEREKFLEAIAKIAGPLTEALGPIEPGAQ
jgi:DNA-binding protein YbaB